MKKVLSLVLALVLVLGMSSFAFGAKLTSDDVTLGDSATGAPFGDVLSLGEIKVGDDNKEIYIYINGAKATKEDIRSGKVDLRFRVSQGGAAIIDSAKIKHDAAGNAYILIEFADRVVSTKDTDFTIKLNLTVNKEKADDTVLEITGTITNPSETIDADDEYIFAGNGLIIEADEYNRQFEIEMDGDVSIFARGFAGKKYYAAADQKVSTEDEAMLAKYPTIESVYNLYTVGLNAAGETVKFNLTDNFYVYALDANNNLVYVGRSNDRVAYFGKYYLSMKELDVASAGNEEENGEGPTEEIPGMGGDDETPANVHDNPGTGR